MSFQKKINRGPLKTKKVIDNSLQEQSSTLSESFCTKLITKLDFGEWYNQSSAGENSGKEKLHFIEALKKRAKSVYDRVVEQFTSGKNLNWHSYKSDRKKDRNKKADNKWIETILVSGTLADKAAAYVVLIQENPFLNFKYLHVLLSMATKKERREAIIAINSLKDLFLSILPKRKLQYAFLLVFAYYLAP